MHHLRCLFAVQSQGDHVVGQYALEEYLHRAPATVYHPILSDGPQAGTPGTTIIFAALGQTYVLLPLVEQAGTAAAAAAPSRWPSVGSLGLAGGKEQGMHLWWSSMDHPTLSCHLSHFSMALLLKWNCKLLCGTPHSFTCKYLLQ